MCVCVLGHVQLGSLPGSVLGIFQARIQERVAISHSRGSSDLGTEAKFPVCLLHCRGILNLLSHRGSPLPNDSQSFLPPTIWKSAMEFQTKVKSKTKPSL